MQSDEGGEKMRTVSERLRSVEECPLRRGSSSFTSGNFHSRCCLYRVFAVKKVFCDGTDEDEAIFIESLNVTVNLFEN